LHYLGAGDGGGAVGLDDAAGVALEWVVGAGMLALGCWGLRRACRHPAPPLYVERPGADAALDERHESLATVELVTQMAEALNRDGDAMRDGTTTGSGSGSGGEEDADARLQWSATSLGAKSSPHSSRSLKSSSRHSTMVSIAEWDDGNGESDCDCDCDDESDSEEEMFLSTLSSSAKSALSSSFLDILKKQSPPMMAR